MGDEGESDHTALPGSTGRLGLDSQLSASCQRYFDEKIVFKSASRPDPYLERLKSNYRPLNPKMPELNPTVCAAGSSAAAASSSEEREAAKDDIPAPKRVLYDPGQLEMRWRGPRNVGAGLGNMGNTCFLNSVLQCLTYTPPLFNYLSSDHHKRICRGQGFCAMCELQRHTQRVMNQSGGVVKPVTIVQNLRVIGKHFRQGRQEDAHEFLRYFVDGLQRSSLQGLPAQLDPHSKATTIIHQVFGGYHCSQVKCSECQKTSETFDPLLDLSLDIKNCSALKQALLRFTKPDTLEGENQYACPFCKKMTPALKRFTLHRLPNILTIQLKRFDNNSLFGGKINKPVSYPLHIDMQPYMTYKKGPPRWYQLYAVLVHSGYSCHSGHYYCYVRSSSKVWYCLNDAQVYQASAQQVLQQEAYLLFYARDPDYRPQTLPPAPPTSLPTSDVRATPTPVKVRADPNFLGKPIKRPPHLDKTGSPFVKLKPTGIVPPSPQESMSAAMATTSPAPQQTSVHPGLPLRKSDVDLTPKTPPQPAAVAPPKPTSVPLKTPSFLPRVIVTPSSNSLLKKKRVAGKTERPRETEPGVSLPSGSGLHPNEVGGTRNVVEATLSTETLSKLGGSDVFIGPRLPDHTHTGPSTSDPASSPSPKVARVTPQPKLEKPVALVRPVGADGPTAHKTIVTEMKGLTGEPLAGKVQQMPRAGWRPVGGLPDASLDATPALETTESKAEDGERASEKATKPSSPQPPVETQMKKKHKKKKRHRTVEESESHRERKHSRSGVTDKAKRRSGNYTSDDENCEEGNNEKRKKRRASQHERKHSRHDLGHGHSRRRDSQSSSEGQSSHLEEDSDFESDRGRGKYRRSWGEKRERRHTGGHKGEERSGRHEEGKWRYSHKSKHRSPSPDQRQRKRKWSVGSEDSHGGGSSRHTSLSHHAKKRHLSDHHHHHHRHSHHHHHHHDRIRPSKHAVVKTKSLNADGVEAAKSGEAKTQSQQFSRPEMEGGHYLEKPIAAAAEGAVEKEVAKVAEVKWDFSLKGEGRGQVAPPGSRWDGSRRDDVVDILTSLAPNQLGTKVKSWDGDSSSLDAAASEEPKKKRQRDDWDRQLDRGKVKKVKGQREDTFPSKNPFQEFQNKKNAEKSNREP